MEKSIFLDHKSLNRKKRHVHVPLFYLGYQKEEKIFEFPQTVIKKRI